MGVIGKGENVSKSERKTTIALSRHTTRKEDSLGPKPTGKCPWAVVWLSLLDHLLETLEGLGLDDVARRLGFENRRLLGEGVDAFARRHGFLVNTLDLQQPGNGEHSGTLLAQVFLDNRDEGVEDGGDLLTRQASRLCEMLECVRLCPSLG